MKGVIRFSTNKEEKHSGGCVVDGVVDGLVPGFHGIHIHECGDLSNGCDSLGNHYNPGLTTHGGPDSEIDQRHVGDLGNIEADAQGRAKFRFIDRVIQVPDIIGRSVVITEKMDDFGKGNNEQSLIDGNSGGRYGFFEYFIHLKFGEFVATSNFHLLFIDWHAASLLGRRAFFKTLNVFALVMVSQSGMNEINRWPAVIEMLMCNLTTYFYNKTVLIQKKKTKKKYLKCDLLTLF